MTDEELITVFAGVVSSSFLSVDLSELRSTRQCSIDPQPLLAWPNGRTIRA